MQSADDLGTLGEVVFIGQSSSVSLSKQSAQRRFHRVGLTLSRDESSLCAPLSSVCITQGRTLGCSVRWYGAQEVRDRILQMLCDLAVALPVKQQVTACDLILILQT